MTKPRIPPAGVSLIGPMVEGFTISAWYPSPDGTGEPTAVAIVFNVQRMGDIVLRLKSRRAVEETIAALQKQADIVFGKG